MFEAIIIYVHSEREGEAQRLVAYHIPGKTEELSPVL